MRKILSRGDPIIVATSSADAAALVSSSGLAIPSLYFLFDKMMTGFLCLESLEVELTPCQQWCTIFAYSAYDMKVGVAVKKLQAKVAERECIKTTLEGMFT